MGNIKLYFIFRNFKPLLLCVSRLCVSRIICQQYHYSVSCTSQFNAVVLMHTYTPTSHQYTALPQTVTTKVEAKNCLNMYLFALAHLFQNDSDPVQKARSIKDQHGYSKVCYMEKLHRIHSIRMSTVHWAFLFNSPTSMSKKLVDS